MISRRLYFEWYGFAFLAAVWPFAAEQIAPREVLTSVTVAGLDPARRMVAPQSTATWRFQVTNRGSRRVTLLAAASSCPCITLNVPDHVDVNSDAVVSATMTTPPRGSLSGWFILRLTEEGSLATGWAQCMFSGVTSQSSNATIAPSTVVVTEAEIGRDFVFDIRSRVDPPRVVSGGELGEELQLEGGAFTIVDIGVPRQPVGKDEVIVSVRVRRLPHAGAFDGEEDVGFVAPSLFAGRISAVIRAD